MEEVRKVKIKVRRFDMKVTLLQTIRFLMFLVFTALAAACFDIHKFFLVWLGLICLGFGLQVLIDKSNN